MESGLYRSKSDVGFGLWYLNRQGKWLFSMPLEGETWHRSKLPPEELESLEKIG